MQTGQAKIVLHQDQPQHAQPYAGRTQHSLMQAGHSKARHGTAVLQMTEQGTYQQTRHILSRVHVHFT